MSTMAACGDTLPGRDALDPARTGHGLKCRIFATGQTPRQTHGKLSIAVHLSAPCQLVAPRGTRTTHRSPDTDTVTNSAAQLGIIFGFTVVVMLLVLWRRR